MRVLYPSGFQRDWIDRNAIATDLVYQGAVIAPHSATERDTYTVPVGRAALIEFISFYIARFAAAAPVGLCGGYLRIDRGGGNITIIQTAYSLAAIGDSQSQHTGSQILLLAGDIAKFYTFDLSTGGSNNYDFAACIIEFDA